MTRKDEDPFVGDHREYRFSNVGGRVLKHDVIRTCILFALVIVWFVLFLLPILHDLPTWILAVFLILLVNACAGELFYYGHYTLTGEGVRYQNLLSREKLIPWSEITTIALLDMTVDTAHHPKIICCVLRDSKVPVSTFGKGPLYYRFHQKQYFVVSYSEERFLAFQKMRQL